MSWQFRYDSPPWACARCGEERIVAPCLAPDRNGVQQFVTESCGCGTYLRVRSPMERRAEAKKAEEER